MSVERPTAVSVFAELSYETARELASHPDPQVRRELALRTDAPAEVLYYLAEDVDTEVRLRLAGNTATPAKADLLLATDPIEAVRLALAKRIGKNKPSRYTSSRSGQLTLQVVDLLARDTITRVRVIIAEALKDYPEADPAVINRLARDVDILVSAPILQFSPVLTDEDLLDIIAGCPIKGALAAISRRAHVASAVTDAIVASSDSQAITHLLRNANAQIQESTLDALIDRASNEPAWQEPLVYRPELTEHSAQRLAEVVAAHLLDRMLARQDLSAAAVRAVAKVVGERLKAQAAEATPAFTLTIEQRFAPLLEKARSLHANGQLDEMSVSVSLLTDHPDDVVAALALRAKLAPRIVLDIIAARSARAICALAWSAGYTPAFAVELQHRLVGLAPTASLKPAADGSFPLREAEMRWQIEMFEGK